MSPRAMAQKGPASTRVRSITRMPASGGRGAAARRRAAGAGLFLAAERNLLLATRSPFEEPLHEALADGGDLLAAGARAPPEHPRAVRVPHVREIEHRI